MACYAVVIGKKPGIYEDPKLFQQQTNNFPHSKGRKFNSRAEAEKFYEKELNKTYFVVVNKERQHICKSKKKALKLLTKTDKKIWTENGLKAAVKRLYNQSQKYDLKKKKREDIEALYFSFFKNSKPKKKKKKKKKKKDVSSTISKNSIQVFNKENLYLMPTNLKEYFVVLRGHTTGILTERKTFESSLKDYPEPYGKKCAWYEEAIGMFINADQHGFKKTYYVVLNGRRPGVYNAHNKAKRQITGFKNHKFFKVRGFEAAINVFNNNYTKQKNHQNPIFIKDGSSIYNSMNEVIEKGCFRIYNTEFVKLISENADNPAFFNQQCDYNNLDVDNESDQAKVKEFKKVNHFKEDIKDINTFYAVKVGRVPGVYSNHEDFAKQLLGYPGAKGKKFKKHVDAVNYANVGRKVLSQKALNQQYFVVVCDEFKGLIKDEKEALKFVDKESLISVKGYLQAEKVLQNKIKVFNMKELEHTNNSIYYVVFNDINKLITNNKEKAILASNNTPFKSFKNKELAENFFTNLLATSHFDKVSMELKRLDRLLVNVCLNKEDKNFIYNKIRNKPFVDDSPVIAYTDGSFKQKPSPHNNFNGDVGAVGAGIVYKSDNTTFLHSSFQTEDIKEFEFGSAYAEIRAVVIAVEAAIMERKSKIIIHHDLALLDESLLKQMCNPNRVYYAYKHYLESVSPIIDVEFVKVKAHSNNKFNNIADKIASINNI